MYGYTVLTAVVAESEVAEAQAEVHLLFKQQQSESVTVRPMDN